MEEKFVIFDFDSEVYLARYESDSDLSYFIENEIDNILEENPGIQRIECVKRAMDRFKIEYSVVRRQLIRKKKSIQ